MLNRIRIYIYLNKIIIYIQYFIQMFFEKPNIKTFVCGEIDDQMKDFYKKNGFLIFENFLTPKKCEEAINAIKTLISEYEPDENSLTVFTTKSHDHRKSKYFRDSADKISFFFEKDAINDGKLVVSKQNAINKVGHALHEKHPLFADITFSPVIQEICKFLSYEDPVVPQSMAILKPPRIGGEVGAHQDSTFLFNEPDTLMGFWVPLEDATLSNGCLWGIPGSHTWPLYCRNKTKNQEEFFEEILTRNWKDEDFVPIEMKRGSLIVFPGHFVHKSHANISDQSRIAYTWHLYDGAKSKWSSENWLQRKEFPKFDKKYLKVVN